MPVYVYETVPTSPTETVERFELRQTFGEPPLETHPATGRPVRRVISGGMGFVAAANATPAEPGPSCGPATCQCGRFN
jgi:predicted nucleic acid-binding Zn ribbon protein